MIPLDLEGLSLTPAPEDVSRRAGALSCGGPLMFAIRFPWPMGVFNPHLPCVTLCSPLGAGHTVVFEAATGFELIELGGFELRQERLMVLESNGPGFDPPVPTIQPGTACYPHRSPLKYFK